MNRIAFLIIFFSLSIFTRASEEESWPDFRGPTHDGRSPAKNPPLRWDEKANIRWKTPIHDRGWSTPVIQGGRIWLTTATADGREFFAISVDRETGRILHDIRLFTSNDPEPLGNEVNGYASPSPVSESGRVYVHFGTYGTACLDAETGRTIWTREDLHCRHFRGPGSSPFIYENLLILTYDGVDVQFLVALDKLTGKTIWKTDRTTDFKDLDESGQPQLGGDFRKAYTTPIAIRVDGETRLVSVGARSAYAYNPLTGGELWKIHYDGYSNASRPLFDGNLLLINTGYGSPDLLGVRASGRGDVTDTHIVWKYSKAVPKRGSPVLVDGLVYMVSENGIAACVESATGRELWIERLKGQFTASPIHADGKVYFFSEDGGAWVIEAGRKFKLLAENRLDEGMMASPVALGNALYLRTISHLYRIEK